MKKLIKSIFYLFWFLVLNFISFAQDFENLGLTNLHITSLKIGYGILAVGTNNNGAYWQPEGLISDNGWQKIDFNSGTVTAVYPHKSGPLGWAIGIGVERDSNNNEFLFCSYLGEKPKPMSYGIDTNETQSIVDIDGFPDPTICGETFAIGGRKLYRRFFADTVWQSVYDLSIEGGFSAIKAKENNGYVYAGGSEGFAGILLIRSSDKGNSWDNLFPNCMVLDLDFYGVTTHKIIVTDHFKIMSSDDSGINWTEIFKTDSLGIQKITYSKDGKTIYVIANTLFYNLPRTYIFYSSDEGESWDNRQLPIYDIIVDMDIDLNDDIYLASISLGVFRLKSPVVNVNGEKNYSSIKEFTLYQNYPNPFNPTTTFSYSIPKTSLVQLKVFNLLGQEVATLVNEEKPIGNYEVNYDASDLSSGVYFYRLKTGNYINIKKMILLK